MAMIYRHEDAKKSTDRKDTRGYTVYENVPCPVCGSAMVSVDYGGYKPRVTSCFSETCLAIQGGSMNIAMIRGDVKGFRDTDYSIANGAAVDYPDAKTGGYSFDLRHAVKLILEDMGFTHIVFVEPDGSEKSEIHTVVMGIHKDPHVNVALREVPKPHRALTFDNKFGTISLKMGFNESHERRYHKWSHITHEIQDYYHRIHGEHSYIYAQKVVLNVSSLFEDESKRQEILAKKRELSGRIYRLKSEMEKHLRYVESYSKDIADYTKRYQEQFGEPYPEK